MPDLSSVAREAAEAEGLRRIPESPMAFHGGVVVDVAKFDRDHFIAGFTECASLLPSEEELATELEKHKLIHASVSRKAAFCRCDSSVKAGTDENLAWFETHRARAVLALIGERLTQ